jgi:kinesin family protein 4/21/27
MERLSVKRRRLAADKGERTQLLEDLDDELENVKANVAYLHENIVECQQNIVEMEQAEAEEDTDEINNVAKVLDVGELGLEESRYFLHKMLHMTVNQCCHAAQKDSKVRELENRINSITTQSTLHQQLLQHMIEQQDLEIFDLMIGEQGTEDNSEDPDSEEYPLPLPPPPNNLNDLSALVEESSGGVGSDSSMGRRDKARRRMTTKEDLLFNDLDTPGMNEVPMSAASSNLRDMGPPSLPMALPMKPPPVSSRINAVPFTRSLSFTKPSSDLMFRSRSFVKPGGFGLGLNGGRYNNHPVSHVGQHHFQANADIMTQSVDPSVISHQLSAVYQPSPVPGRRSIDHHRSTSPRLSTASQRKYSSAVRLNEEQSSPPGSPTMFRRTGSTRFSGEDGGGKNVFHRLVAGTKIGESSKPLKGAINPYQGRIAPKSPLICTSVAEGHNKAVLSVFATDELLFSASKDRTVKVWDLCRKEEVQSLAGHPNNVNVVKYCEANRLVFSVSAAFIKVWDLRIGPNANCIKTLSSSGLTTNGPVQLSTSNRTLVLPPGEALINDIALSKSGMNLYSAAADKVRVWDLRKFHSVGKLSGGHQAAVMCLETGVGGDDGDYVITGSKDHYIKVFKVADGKGGVVTPSMNLEPPHYDGLQNLALNGHTLFSASRDTCIKKWNLNNAEEPLVRSLNNAHKVWKLLFSYMDLV